MTEYIARPSDANEIAANGAKMVVTRFAPSPNGSASGPRLSAICAHDFARAHGGPIFASD